MDGTGVWSIHPVPVGNRQSRIAHSDHFITFKFCRVLFIQQEFKTVYTKRTGAQSKIQTTDGEPHNTITPIARKVGDTFELDLTLRNNITTEEHPLGVYHPHACYHHIKKENIGLIEVMGLAVLPARLKEELELLEEYILSGRDIASNEKIEKHAAWVAEFLPKYEKLDKDNIQEVLRREVGNVFVHVLEDAGVYKCTPEGRDAFMRFINTL